MNQATVTELKTLVERAVRPIWASTSRKGRMREELLAHVTAVFLEESARPGVADLALERTRQRFGSPTALTGQLQESVPASDRWVQLLESVFVGAGLTPLRLACRYALLGLFPGAFLLAAFFVQGRLREWPIIVASVVLPFVCILVVDRLRDALFGPRGRSWRRAVLVGVASWFLIPGATFALCLTFSGDWRSSLLDVLPLIPAALLTPLALIGPAYTFAVDARLRQEWASIQIG